MRKQVIDYTCDNCNQPMPESQAVEVLITISGREYVSDWDKACADALERKINPDKDELTCYCGYEAKSARSLKQHQTKKSHSSSAT